MKICSKPDCEFAGVPQDESAFGRVANNPDGFRYECRACFNREQRARRNGTKEPRGVTKQEAAKAARERRAAEKTAAAETERQRRLESPYESLGFANFQAAKSESAARDDGYIQPGTALGSSDHAADKQKKQEYNTLMGEMADFLRNPESVSEEKIRELALYTAHLAEDEQRFMNRRAARAISLHVARQALDRREWKAACREYLQGKITPTGYAVRPHEGPALERTLCVGLSDIHLGSDLDSRGNPMQYRGLEEARRLDYVLRNVLDYKLDHRDHTELLLIIAGDIIEGQLGHDGRAGAPGAEQRMVFLKLLAPFVGHCARAFKRVRVVCVPGNHGRDIVRHPGRALVDKWDGIEFSLYEQLAMMSSDLKNVTFHLPPSGTAIVGLYGRHLLVAHGDTEPSIRDPDSGANQNATTLGKLSNNRTYGVELHAGFFGHYHKGRRVTKSIEQIFNPAMVPPNGFGRACGGVDEKQGQTMWEATPNHLVGDYRLIEVGPSQDADERLGTLIQPFRYQRDSHGLYSGRVEVA